MLRRHTGETLAMAAVALSFLGALGPWADGYFERMFFDGRYERIDLVGYRSGQWWIAIPAVVAGLVLAASRPAGVARLGAATTLIFSTCALAWRAMDYPWTFPPGPLAGAWGTGTIRVRWGLATAFIGSLVALAGVLWAAASEGMARARARSGR